MANNNLIPSKKQVTLYLLPSFVIYGFTVLIPIVMAVYYGFFKWSGGPKKEFIGFRNYINILGDEIFWKSLSNNFYVVVFSIVVQVGIAFFIAVLLNTKYIKFKNLHRSTIYFPSILSSVIIGFVWSILYDYNYGLINFFLEFFGMGDLKQAWLSNPNLVMTLVCIAMVWQYIGTYLIIFLAGFGAIDTSIFEMAEIDGANVFQRALYITLPMLKNVFAVCVILCFSGSMKSFDHVITMTAGGPGNASNLIALYAYQSSFLHYKLGYGAALSVAILFISLTILLIAGFITKKFNKD